MRKAIIFSTKLIQEIMGDNSSNKWRKENRGYQKYKIKLIQYCVLQIKSAKQKKTSMDFSIRPGSRLMIDKSKNISVECEIRRRARDKSVWHKAALEQMKKLCTKLFNKYLTEGKKPTKC